MTPRLLTLVSQVSRQNTWRTFHTTKNLPAFHECDRRSTYPHISDYKEEPRTYFQRFKMGCSQLKEELGLLKEEMLDKLRMDPVIFFRPGEVDVQWKFNGDPNILQKFVVTCDSDFNEGYSKATLQLTSRGTGIFSGTLDSRLPKDGKQRAAGYCNFRSTQIRKAFKRAERLPWGPYTHLILRVRGDGRTYMLNVTLDNFYDVMWNDVYSYVLYTRGGPYWQYVKVPFSKFYLVNRGRIQDSQAPLRLHMANHFGITVGDDITGPFSLEIDYIGVERDQTVVEEFAYEMYRPPNPYYV